MTEEYDEPESPIVAIEDFSEEVIEMGMADDQEINFSKSRSQLGTTPCKADLSSFDRDKFYKRLGVDPD